MGGKGGGGGGAHMQSRRRRLRSLQQREAAFFDHRVGELQLGDGARVHDLLHRVSGQQADDLHWPAIGISEINNKMPNKDQFLKNKIKIQVLIDLLQVNHYWCTKGLKSPSTRFRFVCKYILLTC